MEKIFKGRIGSLMMPARQVFEFNKAGGDVPASAPSEAPKAPTAAPTEQDAQKAREAQAKRISDLQDKVRKVEADDSMSGPQKNAIIEEYLKEMEAARGAPVLSEEQHTQKNDQVINIINNPGYSNKPKPASATEAAPPDKPGYQSTWDGKNPKPAPPPVSPSGDSTPDYQKTWR